MFFFKRFYTTHIFLNGLCVINNKLALFVYTLTTCWCNRPCRLSIERGYLNLNSNKSTLDLTVAIYVSKSFHYSVKQKSCRREITFCQFVFYSPFILFRCLDPQIEFECTYEILNEVGRS